MRTRILITALAFASAPFMFAQAGSSTTGSSLSPNMNQGAPMASDAGTNAQTTGKKKVKKAKKNKNQSSTKADSATPPK